jgi:carbonic anhydrase
MIHYSRPIVAALSLASIAIAAVGTDAAQTKHWAYEDHGDEVGPAKWGTLIGNEACASGKQQTPINLAVSAAKPQDLPDLLFAYQPSKLSMANNGHTVQMTYDAGSTLSGGGSAGSSTLAQFHFHAPSEHTIDGASFPMEAHLVHVNAAGKPIAVVGVFIKTGRESSGLAKAFQSLPAHEGDKSALAGTTIDARMLLPVDKTFFTYAGSLTTPPCTEGLTWYVFKMPIEMSPAQIAAFTKLEHLGHTNRPIQKLGARTVLMDSTPRK